MGVDISSKQKVLEEFPLWHDNLHIFWSNMIQQSFSKQCLVVTFVKYSKLQNLRSELACYLTRKKTKHCQRHNRPQG